MAEECLTCDKCTGRHVQTPAGIDELPKGTRFCVCACCEPPWTDWMLARFPEMNPLQARELVVRHFQSYRWALEHERHPERVVGPRA